MAGDIEPSIGASRAGTLGCGRVDPLAQADDDPLHLPRPSLHAITVKTRDPPRLASSRARNLRLLALQGVQTLVEASDRHAPAVLGDAHGEPAERACMHGRHRGPDCVNRIRVPLERVLDNERTKKNTECRKRFQMTETPPA